MVFLTDSTIEFEMGAIIAEINCMPNPTRTPINTGIAAAAPPAMGNGEPGLNATGIVSSIPKETITFV